MILGLWGLVLSRLMDCAVQCAVRCTRSLVPRRHFESCTGSHGDGVLGAGENHYLQVREAGEDGVQGGISRDSNAFWAEILVFLIPA